MDQIANPLRLTNRQVLVSFILVAVAATTIVTFAWLGLHAPTSGKSRTRTPDPFEMLRMFLGAMAFLGIGAEVGAAIGVIRGSTYRHAVMGIFAWPLICALWLTIVWLIRTRL